MPRQKISHRMEEAGITCSELANRLKKRKPQITRLLRGDNNFTMETMVAIAEAIGCNYRPLLDSKDSVTTTKPFNHSISSIDGKRLRDIADLPLDLLS